MPRRFGVQVLPQLVVARQQPGSVTRDRHDHPLGGARQDVDEVAAADVAPVVGQPCGLEAYRAVEQEHGVAVIERLVAVQPQRLLLAVGVDQVRRHAGQVPRRRRHASVPVHIPGCHPQPRPCPAASGDASAQRPSASG